jgi:hypothetical protein
MEMYLIVLAWKVFCLNCERVPRSESLLNVLRITMMVKIYFRNLITFLSVLQDVNGALKLNSLSFILLLKKKYNSLNFF